MEEMNDSYNSIERLERLIFSLQLDTASEEIASGDHQQPEVVVVGVAIGFIKAMLSGDKDLAKSTIKMANEGIKELGAAEGFVDSKGRIVTVEDIMNKSSSLDLVQSITCREDGKAGSYSARNMIAICELKSVVPLLQLMSGSYLKAAYNIRIALNHYKHLNEINNFSMELNGNTFCDDTDYMVNFNSKFSNNRFNYRVSFYSATDDLTSSGLLFQNHLAGYYLSLDCQAIEKKE